MKKMLLLLIIAHFFGCTKEDPSQRPMSQIDIWDCHNTSDWTELSTRDALLGSWSWIYAESYWAPDKGWNTESENTLIEFLSDSTLNIRIDGELKSTCTWRVARKAENLYKIHLDSAVTQLLYGRVLICGDMVEFNNSYIDGTDNYFLRRE